jgi:hypothetical protein
MAGWASSSKGEPYTRNTGLSSRSSYFLKCAGRDKKLAGAQSDRKRRKISREFSSSEDFTEEDNFPSNLSDFMPNFSRLVRQTTCLKEIGKYKV